MSEFKSVDTETHTLRFTIFKQALGLVRTTGSSGTTEQVMEKTSKIYHEILKVLQIPKDDA